MPKKLKTIKLVANAASGRFHVVQITDSVKHLPGEWLEEETVNYLCQLADWKVIIVSP